MKKINGVIFVEGSYIPSYDGYSFGMTNLIRLLNKSKLFNITVVHCYRGWSNYKLLKKENYTIHLVPPKYYYHNTNFIYNLLKKDRVDFIQMQDAQLILTQGIKLADKLKSKLILNMHYVQSKLDKNQKNFSNAKNKELFMLEKNACEASDAILCLNPEDQNILEAMGILKQKIYVIPVVLDIKSVKYKKPDLKGNKIVFMGNLFFQPNEDGLKYILNNIYPKLLNYSFYFVGDCPEAVKKEYDKYKNVKFTGVVKNLDKFLKKMGVAVVPIFESSGIRSKILTFFSLGVPVIANDLSIKGIDNKNAIIPANNTTEFIKAINNCFKFKHKTLQISRKARRYVEKQYNSKKMKKDFYSIYSKVVFSKPRRLKQVHIYDEVDEPIWLKEFKRKKKYVGVKPKIATPATITKHKLKQVRPEGLICVFEGLPGSGKTGHVKKLLREYPNCKLVPTIAQGIKRKQKDKHYFFLNDQKKYKQANSITKQNKFVFIEKDHWGTFAYYYAKDKIYKTKQYKALKKKYGGTITTPQLTPDVYIYLDITPKLSYQRKQRWLQPKTYIWSNIKFLSIMRRFFIHQLPRKKEKVPVYIINATKKFQDVHNEIKQILDHLYEQRKQNSI